MEPGAFRVELDGLAKAGDGLVQLPLSLQGVAKVGVGHDSFRVKFDGLAVAGDGLVQLLLFRQGVAEVFVGRGQFRIEFDDLAKTGDGLLQLPLIHQGDAEIAVALPFRVEFDGLAIVLFRLSRMSKTQFACADLDQSLCQLGRTIFNRCLLAKQ